LVSECKTILDFAAADDEGGTMVVVTARPSPADQHSVMLQAGCPYLLPNQQCQTTEHNKFLRYSNKTDTGQQSDQENLKNIVPKWCVI